MIVVSLFDEHMDILFFFVRNCLTAGVSRLGWERGLAAETGKTPSYEKCLKTRRVPQVGCTRCWATCPLTRTLPRKEDIANTPEILLASSFFTEFIFLK